MSPEPLEVKPDSERAAAVRRRDPDTWERLVDSQHKPLFNLHLRLTGDREAAADLTQETFAAAWQSARRYRGAARPETWLHSIALNCHRNWRRRLGRHEPPDEFDDSLPDPAPTAADLAALRQNTQQLYRAVAELPEPYRRAVALRYFAGVPAVEIASTEGVDPGTIRWRLHRAMKQLWHALQSQAGKEQDNGPAAPGRVHLAP